MEAKQKITHITMLSQILLNRLSDKIAENNFSHGLKYAAKNFVKQMEEVERVRYDKFFAHDPKSSDELYHGISKFYEKASNVEIQNMDVAGLLLDLLQSHPKELESAVNKILTSKKE